MNAIASYQYETLQVSITDNILTVTLNRPHKKNAMSFQVINELIKLAGRISKDRTIRAVILWGRGDVLCRDRLRGLKSSKEYSICALGVD